MIRLQASILRERARLLPSLDNWCRQVSQVNQVNSGGSGESGEISKSGDLAASKNLIGSHRLTTGAYKEVKNIGQKNY